MDPHTPFVAASYILAGLGMAGLALWIWRDHLRLTRAIAALEAQGVRRRSAKDPSS